MQKGAEDAVPQRPQTVKVDLDASRPSFAVRVRRFRGGLVRWLHLSAVYIVVVLVAHQTARRRWHFNGNPPGGGAGFRCFLLIYLHSNHIAARVSRHLQTKTYRQGLLTFPDYGRIGFSATTLNNNSKRKFNNKHVLLYSWLDCGLIVNGQLFFLMRIQDICKTKFIFIWES